VPVQIGRRARSNEPDDGPDSAPDFGVRRLWWPPTVGVLLSLLGLALASYLTYEHESGSGGLKNCPLHSGFINCFAVTTSVYSKFHGVPVVFLGLAYFVVMVAFQSPWAWHSDYRVVRWGRIGWCLVGIGFALKLVWDELFGLDQLCAECTAVHIITLLIFIMTVFATVATAPLPAAFED
jgi:uncharacterized membrane protein